MPTALDIDAQVETITSQEETKFSIAVQRLDQIKSALNLETRALQKHKEELDEGLNNFSSFLNSFELAGQDIIENVKKTVPEVSEKLISHSLNSIKAQVAGELKIEMNQLQSDITSYREQLRDFKQDVNFARSMSRKNTILLCLGSVLGSGMAAAAVLLWSGFTLSNHTLTYQNIGKYVHTVVTKQPQEIQQRFWDGLAKLEILE